MAAWGNLRGRGRGGQDRVSRNPFWPAPIHERIQIVGIQASAWPELFSHRNKLKLELKRLHESALRSDPSPLAKVGDLLPGAKFPLRTRKVSTPPRYKQL